MASRRVQGLKSHPSDFSYIGSDNEGLLQSSRKSNIPGQSGIDSLNESKISFGQGLDFNAAVKFSGKERSVIAPDDESDRTPYYALNTTQREKPQEHPLTA